MADEIRVEFMDDGRVKVETDQVSPANHTNAENMMRFLAEELGAPKSKVRKAHTHAHMHVRRDVGIKN